MMARLLLLLVTSLTLAAWADFSAAGVDPVAAKNFLAVLQKAVASDQRQEVANMVSYPITVVEKGKKIALKSAADLLKKYDVVFNKTVKAQLAAQKPDKLFARDQGVMIGNGEIWFRTGPDNKTLKIIGINNQ